MTKTNKTKNARLCDEILGDLVSSTIEDFLSQGPADLQGYALIELAAASISALALMDGENVDLEGLFTFCREKTLRNLKYRLNNWQAKVSAVEAQIEASY